MTRSVWKGTFLKESIWKDVKTFENSKKQMLIWSRGSTITSQLVGYSFKVYNGKKFVPVRVSSDMVGHKFGEFSATRTRRVGSKKDKGNTKR